MTAIAIFVKTPGLSPVKSRLAVDIGRNLAEQWHLMAADAVATLASSAAIGPVYWAVAETEGAKSAHWSGHPIIVQQAGGLGRRMAGIHRKLIQRHGSALLLGADTPQWQAAWLREAAVWLHHEDPRLCLGPAHDGGFWVFGANRDIPEADWEAVQYSRRNTGSQFRRQMDRHGQWLELPSRTDLDRIDDLPTVIAELERLEDRTRQQSAVLDWLTGVSTQRNAG